MSHPVSKKRKQMRATGAVFLVPEPPRLKVIKPLTQNQSKAFKAFHSGQHLFVHGYAGTGKSFLGLWLALNEVTNNGGYKRVVIIRSAVPSRDLGFLPGTPEEKAAVYEEPYRAIVDDLFGRTGSYNRLKETKVVDFQTTSFLRGLTIDDAVVVVDEVQNMTDSEINTVMTRLGDKSRVILLGDFRQGDLKKGQPSGIGRLMETLDHMQSFTQVDMGPGDIVRSGLVKEWILARG